MHLTFLLLSDIIFLIKNLCIYYTYVVNNSWKMSNADFYIM